MVTTDNFKLYDENDVITMDKDEKLAREIVN